MTPRQRLVPILVLGALAWGTAAADTFRCTSHDPGCVIASIAKSNANGPAHDYLILEPGTYLLDRPDNEPVPTEGANGLPVVTGALTIYGRGGEGRTLLARKEGSAPFRILDNARSGGLTVYGVTIMNGELDIRFVTYGGCIRNSGSMMLINVVVRECAAHISGGIANFGELLIQKSVIMANYAELAAGGIGTTGRTTIERGTWVGDNVAWEAAGLAVGPYGKVILRNMVVDGNVSTSGNGGGIAGSGTVEIETTLISENFSALNGGGMVFTDGTVEITNSTFWANDAEFNGGGLAVMGGAADLEGVAVLFIGRHP